MTVTALHVHEPAAALRGTRTYVHSTDLYEEIVRGAVAAGLAFEGPVDLRIRTAILHRPRYVYLPADDVVASDAGGVGATAPPAAHCTFTSHGRRYRVVVEPVGAFVVDRKPYDETPVARAAQIADRRVDLDGDTGLRPIEALTALGVLLHKTAFPPPADLGWMLGQVQMRRPLAADDTRRLTLTIDRLIGDPARVTATGGTASTRTGITAHDGPLGTMVFVLAPRPG